MKKGIIYFVFALASVLVFAGCAEDPVDDAGLLITGRSQCYMSFFDLLGSDHRTVLVSGTTVIDTVAQTVKAVAKFGTNLQRVKPYSSVVTDALVQPAMGVWVDFSKPMEYTVISGNRQVQKKYTITVTVQQ